MRWCGCVIRVDRRFSRSRVLVDDEGSIGVRFVVKFEVETFLEELYPGVGVSRSQENRIGVFKILHVKFPRINATYETTNASSSYNALQTTYEHQMSYGLTLLANYTWSKCM